MEQKMATSTSDAVPNVETAAAITTLNETENFDTGIANFTTIAASYPQVDFPFTFYNFINELSVSHPKIVAWSECGNYFQIQRHAPELPSLIGKHFHHSVYQSLRRQMNMYGFHLTDNPAITKNLRHTNWWCRDGGYFCRDNPQLHMVRPRRRPERTSATDDDTGTTRTRTQSKERRPDAKIQGKHNVTSKLSGANSSKSSGKRRTQIYAKGSPINTVAELSKVYFGTDKPVNQPEIDPVPQTNGSDETSKPTATVPLQNCDVDSTDDHTGTRFPVYAPSSQSFPTLLHQFISDCAKSNPDIVQWNANHTAFNVEIHHPGLPALLLKYFQHGNYSSLRRQLNFYGFRRDDEGFYRNENFSEGNFRNIVSRAARDRTKVETVKLPVKGRSKDVYDHDELSSVFDHDLSTYDTLKNDDMSFERMEDRTADDRSLDPQNDDENDPNQTLRSETLRKFNVHDKVYVRDKDGVLYTAVIRRHHYGPQFHVQVNMGLVDSMEEAAEKSQFDDHVLMWHYFVHFDYWNVTFDRWASEYDVFVISEETTALAQKISQEHRVLQLEMKKPRTKGKKAYQTIDGATFLREWKKRLEKIYEELGCDQGNKGISEEKPQTDSDESDHLAKLPGKNFSWTKKALSTERKYRQQGLTSRRIPNLKNGITIPFALKKVVVQQWEYINQCHMMPCLPAPTTIRQALNKYLESKNIYDSSTNVVSVTVGSDTATSVVQGDVAPVAEGIITTDTSRIQGDVDNPFKRKGSEGLHESLIPIKEPSHEMRDDVRDQEWRDMADGIAMLFDEALESRLLYCEELPQLNAICSLAEFSTTPYSELYGCEHLLRLFIRLPEMLTDNLPEDEGRQIMAKVNDFIRFLHKNHSVLFTQTHRKLNEFERIEQQKIQKQEEKKRKERSTANNADIASKKAK